MIDNIIELQNELMKKIVGLKTLKRDVSSSTIPKKTSTTDISKYSTDKNIKIYEVDNKKYAVIPFSMKLSEIYTYKKQNPKISGFIYEYVAKACSFISKRKITTFTNLGYIYDNNIKKYCYIHFQDNKITIFRFRNGEIHRAESNGLTLLQSKDYLTPEDNGDISLDDTNLDIAQGIKDFINKYTLKFCINQYIGLEGSLLSYGGDVDLNNGFSCINLRHEKPLDFIEDEEIQSINKIQIDKLLNMDIIQND